VEKREDDLIDVERRDVRRKRRPIRHRALDEHRLEMRLDAGGRRGEPCDAFSASIR
jgi:hypothetical protein